jgi:peroxiredoxin (alkyl hydroperoxide reductase subunit C)
MNAWGAVNNAAGKIIMLSDPYLLFTKAIGAEIDRNSKGMGIRSNRYAMVIENLEVINIQVEKETKQCSLSSAKDILSII